MKIVWDEPKRLKNIERHGYDLVDATEFDWDGALIRKSYRSSLGGSRFMATGFLADDLVTLVFSVLGSEALSVISLRRASRRERNIYDES